MSDLISKLSILFFLYLIIIGQQNMQIQQRNSTIQNLQVNILQFMYNVQQVIHDWFIKFIFFNNFVGDKSFFNVYFFEQPRYLVQVGSMHLRKQWYLNCSLVNCLALINFVILLNIKKAHSAWWKKHLSTFRIFSFLIFSQIYIVLLFPDNNLSYKKK